MPARRAAGLDAAAVALLRDRIADGKRPRVLISGPQFPEGTTGTVVRIGDQAVDGSDFVTVRMTVNGVADELAFAPAELQLPGQARAKAAPRKTTPRKSATKSAPAKLPAAKSAAAKLPATKQPASKHAATKSPATTPAAAPTPAAEPDAARTGAEVSPNDRPAARNVRSRKAASTPKITLSLISAGASWTVTATRGARSVAKSVPVSPGVVTAIADLLANAGISAAVAEVNQTALAEAEERAARLRAELAELDAVLAAHRVPR